MLMLNHAQFAEIASGLLTQVAVPGAPGILPGVTPGRCQQGRHEHQPEAPTSARFGVDLPYLCRAGP